MESQTKLSKRDKISLVLRHLEGNWGFFTGAILLAYMNTICNAFIPQIISVTVDSVLGGKEPDLPGAGRRRPGDMHLWNAHQPGQGLRGVCEKAEGQSVQSYPAAEL